MIKNQTGSFSLKDNQKQLQEKFLGILSENKDGDHVVLAEHDFSFSWEKICFFGEGSSSEYINAVLGFRWLISNEFVPAQRQVVVFIKQNHVINYTIFRPRVFGSYTIKDERLGVCLPLEKSIFTIRQFDNSGGSYKLFILPDNN